MAYAAPAGGILCNELLHPTLPHANASRPVLPAGMTMTKARIVQQLTLLVGFLDWVDPTAPNGDLCASTKAVVQHVLDYTINNSSLLGPHGPSLGGPSNNDNDNANDNAAAAHHHYYNGFDFNNLDLATDMGGFFNFDLLDTFDWLRPEAVSTTQQQNPPHGE